MSNSAEVDKLIGLRLMKQRRRNGKAAGLPLNAGQVLEPYEQVA